MGSGFANGVGAKKVNCCLIEPSVIFIGVDNSDNVRNEVEHSKLLGGVCGGHCK